VPSNEDEVGRDDIEALLEVRRELGPSYDAALVDSFAERIEKVVAERVDEQVAQRRAAQNAVAGAGGRQLALGIISMIAAIPISVVAAVQGELLILLVCWVGIVAVNMAHALQGRSRA
jgi:heme A synthase